MAVINDIIDNATGRFGFDGWTVERTAIVTEVTGDGHEKILNAMNTTGIPVLGTAHPSCPNTFLREAIPTADDSDKVRIRLIYGNPTFRPMRQELDTIEVGGTLSQTQTNKDRLGNAMNVTYLYPVDYEYHDFSQKTEDERTITQGNLISQFAPEHTMTKTRLEYASPGPVARDFVNTVNTAGWNLDPPAAAGTWLCTGILGRSNDGGSSFIVTYSFQYRSDTWETTIYFNDPFTGHPPKDLVAGTGYKTYEIYDITNFNLLGL